MSDVEDEYRRRGIAGILLMVVPILSVLAVGVGYGILMFYGLAGRPAEGATTRIDFRACPDAQPLVAARAEQMGLGGLVVEARADGFSLSAQLPESGEVAAAIPATLAKPGEFRVFAEAEGGDPGGWDRQPLITRSDLEFATVVMGFMDSPYTHLKLTREASERLVTHQKEHMHDYLSMWVDGRRIKNQKNLPLAKLGELDLEISGVSDRARVEFAAETALIIEHGPLPCAVTVAGTTVVEVSR